MATTSEQRVRERLIQQIGKNIVEPGWHFRGSQFFNFAWCGIKPGECYVRFTVDLRCVKSFIEAETCYGLPDQVCMFTGGKAIEDAIKWTADRLMEIHNTVSERTAPYKETHDKYHRALKGG